MTPDPLQALRMDRSMGRKEYYHWRKITRETRHLRGTDYWVLPEPGPIDRAEETAHWRRVARQLAINTRVWRNRARLGLA